MDDTYFFTVVGANMQLAEDLVRERLPQISRSLRVFETSDFDDVDDLFDAMMEDMFG
jgi:hypothetical protein